MSNKERATNKWMITTAIARCAIEWLSWERQSCCDCKAEESRVADTTKKTLMVTIMVLKTEPDIKSFFFLIFGSTPVFARFLTGLGVLTEPDWLLAPDWTGRTGRSGPVFKTMVTTSFLVHFFFASHEHLDLHVKLPLSLWLSNLSKFKDYFGLFFSF